MPTPTNSQFPTKDTEQQILNKSFDPDFQVLVFENLEYNPTTNALVRKQAEGFRIPPYDYIGFTYPDTMTDVLTYKTGGAAGTTVATITTVYTTEAKDIISSITKT
jgi:hypothetical protein